MSEHGLTVDMVIGRRVASTIQQAWRETMIHVPHKKHSSNHAMVYFHWRTV